MLVYKNAFCQDLRLQTEAVLAGGVLQMKQFGPAVPFGLVLLEDLPFRVVSDDLGIDEAPQIQPLGPELGHGCPVNRRSLWG